MTVELVDRNQLMRVDGSIQARSTFVAPVEFGLRTGETVILRPEGGGPGRLLALVESAAAAKDANSGGLLAGTIQILAIISEDGALRGVTSVPTFFGDVEPISSDVGRGYYGSIDRIRDPVTKTDVQPAGLNVGVLLTDPTIPVVLNACGFNRHTALLAQSGAGKSYALGVILEELLRETQVRLVVLDPNGDFSKLRELPYGNNMTIADSPDPMRHRSAVRKIFQARSRGVVFNLNSLESVLWESIVTDIVAHLWERRDDRQPTIIVLDEAHNFVPSAECADSVSRILMKIAAEGRKYGLWLILASQRPQKLHPNVISQCDNLIVMKLSSHFDIDHIASAYGAVDRGMIQLVAGFRSGSALIAGRVVKSPTLMRFRERQLPEAGGDISLDWGCVTA